jgi:hypothetical protein
MPGGGTCTAARCVAESQLLYVNKAACNDSGPCSFAAPCCTVKKGLDQSAASAATTFKPVIVFGCMTYAGASVAPQAIATYQAFAVGVGQPTITPASNSAALTLAGGGATPPQITVGLDGFVLTGATGASGNGIFCSGAGGNNAATKLTLVRSTVSHNEQLGVNASNCDVTLDQDLIDSNTQGGVQLQSSDHTLQNCQVTNNGASGSAVGGITATGTSARALMVNNTIVANQMLTGVFAASGAECVTGGVFFNNVVAFNSGGAGDVDATKCAPDHSAYKLATGNNYSTSACMMASQLFTVSPKGLYVPNATATCVHDGAGTAKSLVGSGEASYMGVSAPSYDLAGATRPNPPAIGALE